MYIVISPCFLHYRIMHDLINLQRSQYNIRIRIVDPDLVSYKFIMFPVVVCRGNVFNYN